MISLLNKKLCQNFRLIFLLICMCPALKHLYVYLLPIAYVNMLPYGPIGLTFFVDTHKWPWGVFNFLINLTQFYINQHQSMSRKYFLTPEIFRFHPITLFIFSLSKNCAKKIAQISKKNYNFEKPLSQ